MGPIKSKIGGEGVVKMGIGLKGLRPRGRKTT